MKTALLVTSSAHTQRVLTELIGESVNFLPVTPPAEVGRAGFDALFAKWLRLVDVVVLDGESLDAAIRWAMESLAADHHVDPPAVVVLMPPTVAPALAMAPADWLTVPHGLPVDQLRQTLTTFLTLRAAQARLKHVETLCTRPVAPAGPAPAAAAAPDLHRYRDALKNISRLLNRQRDGPAMLEDFLQLVRDLIGVGKLALLLPEGDQQLRVAASDGVAREVAEHLRLSTDAGIGRYVAREAKIVQRAQVPELAAAADAPQMAREFELLGAEVAVPLFADDQLAGVLTCSGKVTGEPWATGELELVYHLLAQLGQALRNRQLAAQIADQQRLLAEVLAHVPTGVVVVNDQQQVLHLNRRAAELLDGERLPTRVGDVLFEVLQTGREVGQREVELPGTRRSLSVSATRFAAAGQSVVVGLLEDLTWVKAEQQRARAEADRELFGRLSARLSHELKNALVSIKVFAQLLPERYADPEFREQFSQTVSHEVNRVDLLVNNLMFFAQPLALVREPVRLAELLDDAVEHAAGAAAAVAVKKNYTHQTPQIEVDRIRMQQALEHVVRNAVQSMPAGGRLVLNTADAQPDDFADGQVPAGGAVRIEIQDTGEGIGLDDLPHVTEPFMTTRNVGVGLGLTIVKQIVERHGGRLVIDSTKGRGTTVTILLPAKADLELPPSAANAANAVPTVREPQAGAV